MGQDGLIGHVAGVPWLYTGGTGSQSGPSKPSLPAGSFLIDDYILMTYGKDWVDSIDVGRPWESPRPSVMDVETVYERYDSGAENNAGVIWGGDRVHAPVNPEAPYTGANIMDMRASATISVYDQYGVQYGYFNSGEINQLRLEFVGNPTNGDYGTAFVGLEEIPYPGEGTIDTDMGLGYSIGLSYTRAHEQFEQSDPELDGYPSYLQGKNESLSAYIHVTLTSSAEGYQLSNVVEFRVLNASGGKMG
jgi:hypothetical protein